MHLICCTLERRVYYDNHYILLTQHTGSIHIWEVKTGKPITKWKGHQSYVSALKWHPFTELVVTGSVNTAFWLQIM